MLVQVRQIEIKEKIVPMDRSEGRYYSHEENKKTYEIVKWYGEDGNMEYFGLPIDERELFSTLIKIGDDLIRRKVDLEVEVRTSHFNMAIKTAIETATDTTIKYICKLPWWRRLFNAF